MSCPGWIKGYTSKKHSGLAYRLYSSGNWDLVQTGLTDMRELGESWEDTIVANTSGDNTSMINGDLRGCASYTRDLIEIRHNMTS